VAIPIEKQREETSVVAAVVDVLDAGQRVLLDRIELLSVEARAAGSTALTSFAYVLFGLGLLLVGWVATNALAIVLIARIWSHAEAIGLVAVVNLAAGTAALLLARRRGERSRVEPQSRPHAHGKANGGTVG
jgi:hypothetical protein